VQLPVFEYPCLEPFVDQPSYYAIRNSPVEKFSELGWIDAVEIFAQIKVQNPSSTPFHNRPPDGA
jgi:hypothetical protein